MARKHYKGRAKARYPMSFKKMCNLVGITPLQRVKLLKIMNEKLKNEGVDNNNA